MNGSYPHGYAGWFVLDVRLLILTAVTSLLFAVGTTLLVGKGREVRERIWFGVRYFFFAFTINIVFLQLVFSTPIFRIEAFFPFP